ncbi:uncharacterized protein DNG_05352 [Cephalotrichum gorgonifer]|uniref:Uncharacterized protein n=1 Tax=Cephalotrichum gorgonifer TaxID=2041049 RepID=A0AAE8MZR4_9PEZI|nr:uncharacterized protein DNG_05352 [Cephalotrichum gorgonifer]
MDELRELSKITASESARHAYKKHNPNQQGTPDPKGPPPLPKLIRIQDGSYKTELLKEAGLLQLGLNSGALGPESEKSSASKPWLELVVVGRGEEDSLDLPQGSFETLFRNLDIDPVTLQHVYMCSYGFYHYDSHSGPGQGEGKGEGEGSRPIPTPTRDATQTFYFGCFLFSLVWSFNPTTMKTSAVLVLRTIQRHYFGILPLLVFEATLKVYKHRLSSPFSLAFVLFISLTHVLDDNLYRNVMDLRKIEVFTDHGPSTSASLGVQKRASARGGGMRGGADGQGEKKKALKRQGTGFQKLEDYEENIKELTEVSQRLAEVNVHLANLMRHAKLLTVMALTLEDKSFREPYCARVTGEYASACEKDIEFFLTSLPSLKRRIVAIEPSIEYVQDRAKSLYQVVFGLLTHEDAQVNLEVAKTSMEVAQATRKDSAAMKTIALMTMLFLPGTFYATLFSMPSLKWKDDKPGVIQDGFNLYWAITIPSTLLILLTSVAMHKSATLGGWAKEVTVGGAVGRVKSKLRLNRKKAVLGEEEKPAQVFSSPDLGGSRGKNFGV